MTQRGRAKEPVPHTTTRTSLSRVVQNKHQQQTHSQQNPKGNNDTEQKQKLLVVDLSVTPDANYAVMIG